MVSFNLAIEGGQLLESTGKLGIANLTAQLLNKGTKDKTVKELEESIHCLLYTSDAADE